jgi:hypothetical protein
MMIDACASKQVVARSNSFAVVDGELVAWRGDEIRSSFVSTVRSLIISYEYRIHFLPE